MLMLPDLEETSRGLAESLEYKEIGLRLGRDSSVISREVARPGGRERYRAPAAHEAGWAGRARAHVGGVGGAGAAEAVRGGAFPAAARGGLSAAACGLVAGVDRGPRAHRVRGRR